MGAQKALVLVLDASQSMKESISTACGIKSKISSLKAEIAKVLDKVDEGTRVVVLSFGNRLVELYDGISTDECGKAIQEMQTEQPATLIWDSLEQVFKKLEQAGIDEAKVLCVTDGEDTNSVRSRSEVEAIYAAKKGLELKVLILGSKLGEFEETDEDIVLHVASFDEIAEKFSLGEKRNVSFKEAQINPLVMNLSKDGAQLVETAGKSLRKVFPYLEALTGLRYYPVPTFIVDREIARVAGVSVEPVSEVSAVNPSEVMVEIGRFVKAVALAYHTTQLYTTGNNSPEHAEPYVNNHYELMLPRLTEEQRAQIRYMAEVFGIYVEECGKGDMRRFDYLERLKQVTKGVRSLYSVDTFECVMNCLSLISNVMRDMHEICDGKLAVSSSYFEGYQCEHPVFEIWEQYAQGTEISILKGCVNKDGIWDKDAGSIAKALKIAVAILRRAYKDLARTKVKYLKLTDELRLFGCYCSPALASKAWLEAIFSASGIPKPVGLANTGYVLIYSDVCKQSMGYSKDSGLVSEDSLWQDFIGTVLCHEHLHAIVQEGLNDKGEPDANFIPLDTAEKTVLSEATAEWSEIEFARDNPKLLDIIVEHAEKGTLPAWPYRGALNIEAGVKTEGIDFFRQILEKFRSGEAADAYKKLL